MGLDSVELVMAVEEEFDLTIYHADAAREAPFFMGERRSFRTEAQGR